MIDGCTDVNVHQNGHAYVKMYTHQDGHINQNVCQECCCHQDKCEIVVVIRINVIYCRTVSYKQFVIFTITFQQ